jgi:glutamate dehydrogenase/leucine dehydrogenase
MSAQPEPIASAPPAIRSRRATPATWLRYANFIREPPELTIAWHDPETDARAWLVMNSTRGGAAGGGTRIRAGVGPREVVYLAKVMELKFAIAGPPIGGAKAGIDFDPTDARKRGVLERWFRAIRPILLDRYGTGGDLNVDEVTDLIPTFERIGLAHPQQGIIAGHLRPKPANFRRIMGRMNAGVVAPVGGAAAVAGIELTVSDLVTGYGVAAAVRRVLEKQDRQIEGARVLLEGFGNVGAASAVYLARAGARIVAISDARQSFLEPDGLDAPQVEELLRRSRGKVLPSADPRVHPGHDLFWSARGDVFVCAAISGSITVNTLARLDRAGVAIVACGANQPFAERMIGSSLVAREADSRFTIIPDIVANCGMARTFSYLMEEGSRPDARSILTAVDRTIHDAIDEIVDRAPGRTRLLAASLELVLDRVEAD